MRPSFCKVTVKFGAAVTLYQSSVSKFSSVWVSHAPSSSLSKQKPFSTITISTVLSPICPITSVGFWRTWAFDSELLSLTVYFNVFCTSPSTSVYLLEYSVPLIV